MAGKLKRRSIMTLYPNIEKLQVKPKKVYFLSFVYIAIIFFLMAGGIFCLLDIHSAVRYIVIALVSVVIIYIMAMAWRR
jgi:hypothetical protein